MEYLIKIFFSYLRSTLSTGIFISLAIIFFKAFDKKINVRVKNIVWILILIKLLIPVSIPVSMNLFDALSNKYAMSVQSQQASPVTEKPLITDSIIASQPPFFPGNNITGKVSIVNMQRQSDIAFVFKIAAVVWLDGVVLLSLFLLIAQYKFKSKMKKRTDILDSKSLALIQELKVLLSIKSEIPIVINNQINSPCISGIFKPTIYIPEYIIKVCDTPQLSHILLHELVHYKRKDLIYNLLSIIALNIHWYNPLVWLAVKKMKLYRECCCDAFVLEILDEEESIEYGMTLLNYSRLYLNRNKYSQLPIYFETKNQIKERITMIKGFHKGSYKVTGKVILSCAIAASVIFTNNLEVKALNADNLLKTTSSALTAPGRGSGWYHQNNNWYYKQVVDKVIDNWYGIQDSTNETEYWLFDSGKWFYFDGQGIMVNHTTLKIEGKDYTFNENGVCTNKVYKGWVLDDGDSGWYYFDENGIMLKNTTIDENVLDEHGKLVKAKERKTTNDKSQYNGWYQENGKWYCKLDGKNMTKAWVGVGGNTYYFDEQGVMVSNTTIKVDDKNYIFDQNGVCTNIDEKKGWNYDDGQWSYYDNNGVALKNTTIDGYKLDSNGVRVESENIGSPEAYYIQGADGSLVDLQLKDYYVRDPESTDGWYSKEDAWYLKKDNKNITGWVKHNHAWVYLDNQGKLVKDTTLKIDGKDYVFNFDGVCTNKLD